MASSDRQRGRRALSQVGGAVRTRGDAGLAERLADAARPPEGEDAARALTHGFHAWPARMHPVTARRLIALADQDGGIADPFMGGGTVVLEAVRAGRLAYGGDVNPIALEVAWARTRWWSRGRCEALVKAAEGVVGEARAQRKKHPRVPQPFFEAEGQWYDPPALVEVFTIARAVDRLARADEVLARMLRVCLSSILVKASRQASDSVTRRDDQHRFVPRGRVEQWFARRVEEHARNLAALAEGLPEAASEPRLALRDARKPLPLPKGRVAAIVSSPPYPGTYDYVAHHARRYAALGLDASLAERAELGSRREQRKLGAKAAKGQFERDLAEALGAWREALAPGGWIYFVIGDGQAPKGIVPVLPLVEAAARARGYAVRASVSQPRRVRGFTGRGADSKEEHVVALQLESGA